jgi:N-acetylmuramic acid 6-phosphate (MurNAc-6-P) etherase
MELAGVEAAEAEALLQAHGGLVRKAVQAKTGASRI